MDKDDGFWDYLPDTDEYETLAGEGGPYDPTKLDSHPDDGYTLAWPGQIPDNERHNCNSYNAVEWGVGTADQHDWARPGNQWPQN